ncbi:hypothetical protein G7054_g3135 [Neopestalotiopsis clavispora]|nr:hypothetical protein G7054_g3135 [Neopestalotiopsis clavispora]
MPAARLGPWYFGNEATATSLDVDVVFYLVLYTTGGVGAAGAAGNAGQKMGEMGRLDWPDHGLPWRSSTFISSVELRDPQRQLRAFDILANVCKEMGQYDAVPGCCIWAPPSVRLQVPLVAAPECPPLVVLVDLSSARLAVDSL